MDRLRSTRRTRSTLSNTLRIFAGLSVAGVLAAAVYFIFTVQPDEDEPTTTTASVEAAPTSATAPSAADSAAPTEATEVVQQVGGVVRVGTLGRTGTMNLLSVDGDRSLVAIQHLVGASALRLDPLTHDLLPAVFAEIPSLGTGGLIFNADGTMTVRADIADTAQWSDGTAITGADFQATYDIVEQHRGAVHPDIVEAQDRIVPGSLIVSDRSVEFTLIAPTFALDRYFSLIVPAHQVNIETFPSDWDDALWASAGPFEWVATAGSTLRFERNDLYDGEPAIVDGLELTLYDTIGRATAAFDRGEIDVIGPLTDGSTIAVVEGVSGSTVDVLRGPGWEHISFQFGPGASQVNPASVTDRQAIRQAIYAAIDRQVIAEIAQGRYGEPIDSVVGIGWPTAGEPVWQPRPSNPGLLTGATLILATTGGDPTRENVVDVIVDQLSAAGANVTVITDERGRFFGDLVLPGEFEMAEWAWVSSPGPGATAGDLLNWFTASGEDTLDFSQWSTVEPPTDFASFATGLNSIVSHEDLAQRLAAAERALADEIPVIPLYADLNAGAAHGHVGGYEHSSLPGGVLATAASWWLAGE